MNINYNWTAFFFTFSTDWEALFCFEAKYCFQVYFKNKSIIWRRQGLQLYNIFMFIVFRLFWGNKNFDII